MIKKGTQSSTSKENTSSKALVKNEVINKQTTGKNKEVVKAAVGKQVSGSKQSIPTMTNKTVSKTEETKVKESVASNRKSDSQNKPIKQIPSNVPAKPTSSRQLKETTAAVRASEVFQAAEETILDDSPAENFPDFNVGEEAVKDTSALTTADAVDEEKPSEVSPDFPSVDSGITMEQQLETRPQNVYHSITVIS